MAAFLYEWQRVRILFNILHFLHRLGKIETKTIHPLRGGPDYEAFARADRRQ